MADFSFVRLVLVSVFLIVAAQAGFYKYQCPEGPDVRSPCESDCILNHGSYYGYCGRGNDYNCYCTRPVKKKAFGLQCWDPQNPKYIQVCQIDCRCNHGALDGVCDYVNHVCECVGQNPDPIYYNASICPFPSQREMELSVIKMKLPGFPTKLSDPLYPPKFNISDMSTLYPVGFNPYNICAASALGGLTNLNPFV